MVVVIKMVPCMFALVFLVAPLNAQHYQTSYSIPDPEIQAFSPRGFRVSIEDSPGIRLFAFHGNINKELGNLEEGAFSENVLHKQNGRWTYEERDVRLRVGDVLHFWIFVIKDELGYKMDKRRFVVKELQPRPSTSGSENPVTSPSIPIDCGCAAPPQVVTASPGAEWGSVSEICEQVVLNTTRVILSLQSQVDRLERANQRLQKTLEKYPDGRTLTLSGRIPDEDARLTASFIIREKLGLNPTITSAVRNDNKSITLEVETVDEKLEILEAAKEHLTNTKIIIV